VLRRADIDRSQEPAQVREHEKEVTANEAAAAQQSSALKAQQQALDERQRSLDEVRAELSSKVSVTPPPLRPWLQFQVPEHPWEPFAELV
jgi:hypothetical protein